MREMQFLIKPVSSMCNLQCSYCFYMEEARQRIHPSYGKMSEETAKKVIKKAMETEADCLTFGFQGGEPALAGLNFYRKFTELVKRYNKKRKAIFYVLQTNGICLTEEWFSFLKDENFLVGISLDGTKEIHDRNRKDGIGRDTYLEVRNIAKKMQDYGIAVNILCVITKEASRHIRRIYRTLRSDGFYYQQYLLCLDALDGKRSPWSLREQDAQKAMCELFDLWFADRVTNSPVFIRDFDQWLHLLLGKGQSSCVWRGQCSMQNVIEANGDVYPCDFYVLDGYCFGNVWEEGFSFDLDFSKQRFLQEGKGRGDGCESCKWYPLCRGGCRREYTADTNGRYRHRFCKGYQVFFSYAIERLEWLAAHQSVR